MTTQIELTRGKITTHENEITSKVGKYDITANYGKVGDGKFANIRVTVTWVSHSAHVEQYGDDGQVIYSLPEGLPASDKGEIIAILDDVFTQIKTF